MASDEKIVVLVTVGNADDGTRVARALVESKLAACVNIIPQIRSIYMWKEKISDDSEALLVIKSRRSRFEALRRKVVELHSYDVPEVIALPIQSGHAPYLKWIEDVTGGEV